MLRLVKELQLRLHIGKRYSVYFGVLLRMVHWNECMMPVPRTIDWGQWVPNIKSVGCCKAYVLCGALPAGFFSGSRKICNENPIPIDFSTWNFNPNRFVLELAEDILWCARFIVFHAISFYIISYHTILYHTALYIIFHYGVLYHIIWYEIISYHKSKSNTILSVSRVHTYIQSTYLLQEYIIIYM